MDVEVDELGFRILHDFYYLIETKKVETKKAKVENNI